MASPKKAAELDNYGSGGARRRCGCEKPAVAIG
jgi:hypothetical protein